MDKIFAPYTFIPFSNNKVPETYKTREELPSHARVIEGNLTGWIEYHFKAETPVSVGGERDHNTNCSKFCRDGLDRLMIPGSTVRGMVRSHAEMLSFSYPEFIDDNTYMYRKFAGNCKQLRTDYSTEMNLLEKTELKIPAGVKAGWLSCDQNNNYYITPVEEFGQQGTTYFKIHERDLREKNILDEEQYMYTEKIDRYSARKKEMSLDDYKKYLNRIKNDEYHPYRGKTVSFDYDGRFLNLGSGRYTGRLLNSEWIEGKTHHYLVSEKMSGDSFQVSKEQILDYERDYERNKIQNKKLGELADFYALPERGNKKLFFYKKVEEDKNELLGMGPTPYFRIFFKNSVHNGIHIEKPDGYDYVSSVFGYAGKRKCDKSEAYKSRVSFSDALYEGNKKPEYYSLTLSSPKGTAIQMYLDQTGKDKTNLNTYNNSFSLRGYKVYWKRNGVIKDHGVKKNVMSRLETLPKDSVFKGTVYFDNLREDELGLLLLSLRFNKEGSEELQETYMIGGGKPYGFGKIKPYDIKLHLINQKKRFTNVNLEEEKKDQADLIEHYKKVFIETLETKYKIKLKDQPTWKIYKKYIEQAGDQVTSDSMAYADLKTYASYEPLSTAAEILYSGNRKDQQKKRKDKENGVLGNRLKAAVWIANREITPAQLELLKKDMGIKSPKKITNKKEIKEQTIRDYAKKCGTILLPYDALKNHIKKAMELYDRVLITKKGPEGEDAGWEKMK